MKVNVFHVEGALSYVLSAHETTTIHFWEKEFGVCKRKFREKRT